MADNVTTTSCTKHVCIRYKYVNKFIEERIVQISFVKSAVNDSNILIKNLCGDLHRKSLNQKQYLEIFEHKRKVVRDDILSSNI